MINTGLAFTPTEFSAITHGQRKLAIREANKRNRKG